MAEDVYGELIEATPEELLEAAIWFYQSDHLSKFLRLGFELARPEGWKHIAPYWLKISKEAKTSSEIERDE